MTLREPGATWLGIDDSAAVFRGEGVDHLIVELPRLVEALRGLELADGRLGARPEHAVDGPGRKAEVSEPRLGARNVVRGDVAHWVEVPHLQRNARPPDHERELLEVGRH